METERLEKYSSAITLSDMEVFVFPELAHSLVLANIMSPVIWQWRELDCFKKLEGKPPYKKLMRLRQFIMDEYEFNLDLETWGLTSKTKELKRFEKFISPEDTAKSNALFGYEGDKYYFDVDIRKHFGLDKYDSDIIPYWKTETVEAMNAFRLKAGYKTGAGECVSLSSLYAAAAFVVCGIPLDDIYMILTPLHSQNFIDIQDGVLTNNRRLVTKTMWFNGTEISNKAQRALRNENVTIVSHPTGYTHCLYSQATIDKSVYEHLQKQLAAYLSAPLSLTVFAGFLRTYPHYQKFFQICHDCRKKPQFLKAEILFNYEHTSDCRVIDKMHDELLAELSEEDFVPYQIPGRIRCDELNSFIEKEKPDIRTAVGKTILTNYLGAAIPNAQQFVEKLLDFLYVEAKLPVSEKIYKPAVPIKISPEQNRERIIDYLQQIRSQSVTADLAFYAYRDMESCDWLPFIKAAIERSPVSLGMTSSMSLDQIYHWLEDMNNTSIYDGKRLAQPDEAANYKTADGLEKAILLANVIRQRNPEQNIEITVDNNVVLKGQNEYKFTSAKGLKARISLAADGGIKVKN